MNLKKLFKILSFTFAFLIVFSVNVFSADMEFDTKDLWDKQVEMIVNSMTLNPIDDTFENKEILSFDINKRGEFLLCCGDESGKYLLVYDKNSKFMYGYSFGTTSMCKAAWNFDEIIIYDVKNSFAYCIDTDGKCYNALSVDNGSAKTKEWKTNHFSTERAYDGKKYVLENDNKLAHLITRSYNKLVQVDLSGNTKIIYSIDSNEKQNIPEYVLAVIYFLVFVPFIVAFIVKMYLARKKRD